MPTLSSVKTEILNLTNDKQWSKLRTMFTNWELPEIADLLLSVEDNRRVILFRALPRSLSADVFSYLTPDKQDELLGQLNSAETKRILADLDPDDRTALLEELPATATRRMMQYLNHEDLKEARQLLGYPDESVGRLMTPDYISVLPEHTVAQALEIIRTEGRDSETINRIYVCDHKGVLIDDFKLRSLILSAPTTIIKDITDGQFISLSAFDDREKAVQIMQKYDFIALPVVDSDGVLLGIVTVDDVMDVAELEVTEDIQKAASVEPLKMSYTRAGIWTLYRKRITWLVILVAMNLGSAAILASYEQELQSAIALIFFIPILLGTAGNTGAQSATIMLRALVTGDIDMQQWFKSFIKELGVGALLGITLGILGWLLGFVHHGANKGYEIGIIVGVTMIGVVMVSNFVGMTLPFILARLKLDPAVASSPLITTIADVSGLLIYFNVANLVGVI